MLPRISPPGHASLWTLTYVAPLRIARSNSANSPARMPLSVGPMTSAATIVPVTVPAVVGHAGFPPPHRKAEIPPFTSGRAKWMCENSDGVEGHGRPVDS